MQAIVKEKRAPGLKVTTVAKPSAGPGEVLIAVRHAGVGGTDLHIADWDTWARGRLKPPLVVGHEFAGEIVAVGDGVGELKVGQPVTAEGHIVCGHCVQCRTGNGHICRNTRIIGVDLDRSEEHTSELQSQSNLVCRLLLEKKITPSAQLCN